jgi:fibronectin-binding autotransporter adhesin
MRFSKNAIIALVILNSPAAADIVTGAGAGASGGHVKVFDGQTNALNSSFLAYPSSFSGGVRVAAGDVSGDGHADIVTGAGPGAVGGHVKVFDGQSGAELRSFFAFEAFSGGVFVASGDVSGDGRADIITATDVGAPGHVKVFDGQTNSLTSSFLAYPAGSTGGVRVGAGDIDRDGFADIITGAGPGAVGGHVKVFSGQSGAELRSFFAFEGFSGGVFVAGGDVNGDGFVDIVTGAGDTSPGGHVKVFDGQSGALYLSFFAYPTGFTGGVRVGAADVDGDGLADIITGAGPGAAGGHVKVFSGQSGTEIRSFLAYEGFSGGVYVSGASTVVPEPTSAILLLLAGIGIAVTRLRFRCPPSSG